MTWRFVARAGMVSLCVLLLGCSQERTPDAAPQSHPNPPLPVDPYEAGKVEAKRDIQKGVLMELTFGKAPEWLEQYKEHLRTNYHVEVVVVAEDELSLEMIDRIRGYNEISVPEIERLHGAGVLKKVAETAEGTLAGAGRTNTVEEPKPAEALPVATPTP